MTVDDVLDLAVDAGRRYRHGDALIEAGTGALLMAFVTLVGAWLWSAWRKR